MSKEEKYGKDYFEKYGYTDYSLKSRLPFFDRLADLLVSYFRPNKVLDIGCAMGFLVQTLRQRGVECYGVDVSEYALRRAPADVAQYLYKVNIDSQRLPFKPEYFDLVTILSVLEHLHNDRQILSEIKRVLERHGVVLAVTDFREIPLARHPTHVNVHNKSFWQEELRYFGFSQLDVTSNFRGALMDCLLLRPGTKIGKSLAKLGCVGRQVRRWGVKTTGEPLLFALR